ncbi:tRNA threonylcarbamoyladenosine dehydratase [Permianibacter sp. IMCC34836]|uniref:tRNA threonylcarbamoyladenosine dehydratase n=1 Tax=Permianibacter fluminis TaxID=2738515 RepID=UPI0015567C5D|nr:tRNA threonylcarbamoyladenosine dehydratase [Permianibacter fluminis]NQD38382.1 tRNA threonylcarbamoyladenosine dehydratase [Permianibacter fluminis]
MDGLFQRTHILVGDEGIARLQNKHVCLAGLGGVGSFAAEALARSGIGELTIIDHDVVAASNLNRQLVALNSTVGLYKADVMAARILDINPTCKLNVIKEFLKAENMPAFMLQPFDYVIDAIDSLNSKVNYLKAAFDNGRPVISSMGAGNKLDPTLIRVGDIRDTEMCTLAKHVRRRLRRMGVKKGIKAVYSLEHPRDPLPPEPTSIGRARAVNGTISYMPAIFGLTVAGVVIKDLLEQA